MSVTTIVLGESGSGKTCSLRNFDPAKVALIRVISKPLPFKATGWVNFVSQDSFKIIQAMQKAVGNGFKIIVIDDFQYLMSFEFMRNADKVGFQKFTDIAVHAFNVIKEAMALPDDVRVYILSHIATGDDGVSRIKTIGKLLDEKITIEGMVTNVLRTEVSNGKYYFRTKNNGSDTVKTALGLFDDELIENDLNAVDDRITAFYGLNEEPDPDSPATGA